MSRRLGFGWAWVVCLGGFVWGGFGCEKSAVAPATVGATGPATTRAATEVEVANPRRAGDLLVEDLGSEETSFKMVYVPGGTFWMGSPDDEPGRRVNEGRGIGFGLSRSGWGSTR